MGAPAATVALLLVAIAAACGLTERSEAARPLPPRVTLIMLENREYGEVIGNDEAPFLNGLARRGTLATRYYGVAHPSLPNYLALLGGSTYGIGRNCTGCLARGDNLAAQLSRAGVSWRAYTEGLPKPCYGGAAQREYVKRHNPFMYFPSVFGRQRRCRNVVSTADLDADLRDDSLPALSWVTPGLCHGGHDCDLRTTDRWVSRLVPRIARKLGRRGFLVVTFDEGTSDRGCCGNAGGGRVATIVAGPAARRGARIRRLLSHFSLLATLETALGVRRIRHARGIPTLLGALRGRD